MEIDPAWLLLLPMIFALGWITARYDRGQQRRERRHVAQDVLSAMSALLADRPRQATEALLSAARSDPESSELHRAVGNLYRRQGLVDRAVEVHETALRTPGLSATDRLRMMMDLGRDYQAAGLFDRAEAVYQELLTHANGSANGSADGPARELANEARAALMDVAQATRNWEAAVRWAKELHQFEGDFGAHGYEQLMGHFYCEKALLAITRSDQAAALSALASAEEFSAAGPNKRITEIRAGLVAGGATPASASAAAPGAALTPAVFSACRVCGFRTRQRLWQCPGCHHWDSFQTLNP